MCKGTTRHLLVMMGGVGFVGRDGGMVVAGLLLCLCAVRLLNEEAGREKERIIEKGRELKKKGGLFTFSSFF